MVVAKANSVAARRRGIVVDDEGRWLSGGCQVQAYMEELGINYGVSQLRS